MRFDNFGKVVKSCDVKSVKPREFLTGQTGYQPFYENESRRGPGVAGVVNHSGGAAGALVVFSSGGCSYWDCITQDDLL
jgi:hypothetical protein